MTDAGGSTGSAAPFETYKTSLQRAKREAAEAREAVDALKTLEETIPVWWQMVVLADRDVTHQSIRTWQEEASELVDSARADFLSGMKSRFHEGAEKVNQTHLRFQDARDALNEDIRDIGEELKKLNDNIESEKSSIKKCKNYISDKNSEIESEKWSRKVKLVTSTLKSLGISLLLIIPVAIVLSIIEAIFGVNLGSLAIFIFALFWVTSTYINYVSNKNDKDIDEMSKKIETKENRIRELSKSIDKMGKEKNKLSNQKKSVNNDIKSITINKKTKDRLESFCSNIIK